jgi:hypothetical protein
MTAAPRISARVIGFDAIIFTAPQAGGKVECNGEEWPVPASQFAERYTAD